MKKAYIQIYSLLRPIIIFLYKKVLMKGKNVLREELEIILRSNKYLIRLQNKLKYDTKTGQRMFSPKREKSYTNNIITIREKDLNRKNLSEYMYSYAKKFLNKKEQLYKINDENFNKTLKMNHTNTYTEVMFKNIKFVVFKKIFHLMDRDSKKVISNFNIDLKDIPSSISDILEPIIYKIKMENCRLDEDNFIECCNLIFDVFV